MAEISSHTASCRGLPDARKARSKAVRCPAKYSVSWSRTSASAASSLGPRSSGPAPSVGPIVRLTRTPSSRTAVSGPIGDGTTACTVGMAADLLSDEGAPTLAPATDIPGSDRLLALLLGLLLALLAVVVVLDEPVQLAADEVTGGQLADRDAQRGQLAGQVLGVGAHRGGPRAVLLGLHAVPVGLPVLRQQDQGR